MKEFKPGLYGSAEGGKTNSLLRLLVGAILIAPVAASAQDNNVVVYGRLNASIDSVAASGATATVPPSGATQVAPALYTGSNFPSTARMTSNASNLGFRGTESLGGGLKAIWQIESSVGVDTGSGTFAGRNSRVGLVGTAGTVFMGLWDTPYKALTIPFSAFGSATAVDVTTIIGNPGFAVPTTTGGVTAASPSNTSVDASFDRRQGNSIQYWTPNWGGVSGRFAYSFGEVAGDSSVGIASMSLSYASGPFLLAYGYERHNDYFGLGALGGARFSAGNGSSTDQGHKLVAHYTIGSTVFKGVYERLDYKNDDTVAGRVNEYSRNAWALQLEHKMGPGKIWAAYGRALDGSCSRTGNIACSTNGLGATYQGVGYWHSLSKRTALYAAYARVANDQSGSYGLGVRVGQNAPGTASRIATLGINHTF